MGAGCFSATVKRPPVALTLRNTGYANARRVTIAVALFSGGLFWQLRRNRLCRPQLG
jgi:hypothetical protein